MPEDDKKFEAALAGFFHRESRDNAARLLCPDPELLAAYHERALSPEESQAIQLHVAGCSRCEEVLAQLAATENLPLEAAQRNTAESAGAFHGQNVRDISRRGSSATTPGSSRSHRQWRWIAPAGAIAAGLLVWIAYRELRPAQKSVAPAVQVAENRKEIDMPAPPSAPSSAAAKLVPQKKAEDSIAADNLAIKIERSNSSKIPATQEPKTREYSQVQATQSVEVQTDALEEPKLADKTAPPSPIPPLESNNITISGAAAAPAPPAEVQQKRATAYGDELTETRRLKAQVTSAALLENNPTLILAPDASVMWRVGAAGSIEFSSTGGGEWQHQTSGVSIELVAGLAPQKNVCWVVGRSGTILLTTDSGTTWRKITSPTKNDLGGVNATDALHATIWELTGQKKFETADGGQAWNPGASH